MHVHQAKKNEELVQQLEEQSSTMTEIASQKERTKAEREELLKMHEEGMLSSFACLWLFISLHALIFHYRNEISTRSGTPTGSSSRGKAEPKYKIAANRQN